MKRGIHMSEVHKNAASRNGRPTGLLVRDRSDGAELAAQAGVMLARYPANVREEVTELLRVLAAKPGEAEKGGR